MIKRLSSLVVIVTVLVVTIACSEAKAPGNSNQTSSTSAQSSAPAAQPAAPAAQASAPAGPEPANVAEIFPAGQGREIVLNNCGSCHNLACSAIGQRTAARWDSLRESHKDKITDADAVAAFTYLKSHFNDANPEPKVPAKFLQGGCTPF
jgi:mono/diheme cytochrome c family protein